LDTILLLLILLVLLRMNSKLPGKKPEDYVREAMERDRGMTSDWNHVSRGKASDSNAEPRGNDE